MIGKQAIKSRFSTNPNLRMETTLPQSFRAQVEEQRDTPTRTLTSGKNRRISTYGTFFWVSTSGTASVKSKWIGKTWRPWRCPTDGWATIQVTRSRTERQFPKRMVSGSITPCSKVVSEQYWFLIHRRFPTFHVPCSELLLRDEYGTAWKSALHWLMCERPNSVLILILSFDPSNAS